MSAPTPAPAPAPPQKPASITKKRLMMSLTCKPPRLISPRPQMQPRNSTNRQTSSSAERLLMSSNSCKMPSAISIISEKAAAKAPSKQAISRL